MNSLGGMVEYFSFHSFKCFSLNLVGFAPSYYALFGAVAEYGFSRKNPCFATTHTYPLSLLFVKVPLVSLKAINMH
jgi:hypothetical protein